MSKAKQVPFSIEAEKSVLGAIFIDPETYSIASKELTGDDFYIEQHRLLYKAMEHLVLNEKLDLVILKAELEKRGQLEKIGGLEYIVELANFVPSSDSISYYAGIVKEYSLRRNMILGYSKAIQDLYNESVPVKNITDYVQDTVLSGKERANEVITFSEAFYDFLEDLEKRQKNGNKYPGILTGYSIFDMITGGLEDEKVYVLGGRPGMGKTALAINMAVNIARNRKNVLFVSLEMSKNEIIKRIVSYISGVKSGRLKTAAISDDEFVRIVIEGEKFNADNLMIVDEKYQTVSSIFSTATRLNNQLRDRGRKIDCIIIDHLHLLSSETGIKDRRQEVSEISRKIKILAGKLKCPIMALAQLSRLQKGEAVRPPQLTDLRESGNIEQDADVVVFVHREEYYKPTIDNRGKANLIFAKVRDGETTTTNLRWDGTTTTFSQIKIDDID